MAQINYPLCINVDWLQVALESESPLFSLPNLDNFICTMRERGTRQFKSVADIEYISSDGELVQFGTLCSIPTLASWSPTLCSLKIDNSLLYSSTDGGWHPILMQFLESFRLRVSHLSRVDLAGDFLYLKGRVSGSTLAKKIKSCEWWKCGSVNISEHYTMPYNIKWQRDIALDGYDTEIYLNNGEVVPRVESMTFGKISSDAQVILYDKSLELKTNEMRIKDGVAFCQKEYIRDAWKNAGVYSDKRHTWRLEFRLRASSLFLRDSKMDSPRRVEISDLLGDNLRLTYLMATDRYFRLVDVTEGGKLAVTAERCFAMASHKNRLPSVDLFSFQGITQTLCRGKYHVPCNRFNRNVINRLHEISNSLDKGNGNFSRKGDVDTIKKGINSLNSIHLECEHDSVKMREAIRLLRDICFNINVNRMYSTEDVDNVVACRKVLERKLRSQSPTFLKNVISNIYDCQKKIERLKEFDKVKGRNPQCRPQDNIILRDSINVLKSLYVPVLQDQIKEDTDNIYEPTLTAVFQKCANNIQLTNEEYNFYKMVNSNDSPFSASRLFDLKSMFNSRQANAVEHSKDYAQYLQFCGHCDPDYL